MHTFFIGFKNEQKIKKDIYKYMTFFACLYFLLMWFSSHYIFNGEKINKFNNFTLYRSIISILLILFRYGWHCRCSTKNLASIRHETYPAYNNIIFSSYFLFINYELFSFYGANSIHLTVSTYLKPSMFFIYRMRNYHTVCVIYYDSTASWFLI